jgi:hypothetical protein
MKASTLLARFRRGVPLQNASEWNSDVHLPGDGIGFRLTTGSIEIELQLIEEYIAWYGYEPRLAFNRSVVLRYRFFLEQMNLAPSVCNLLPCLENESNLIYLFRTQCFQGIHPSGTARGEIAGHKRRDPKHH